MRSLSFPVLDSAFRVFKDDLRLHVLGVDVGEPLRQRLLSFLQEGPWMPVDYAQGVQAIGEAVTRLRHRHPGLREDIYREALRRASALDRAALEIADRCWREEVPAGSALADLWERCPGFSPLTYRRALEEALRDLR
ncbi:MAG TPA: hypothetical protein VNO22_18245 [Planctomycetota bacterium]|nr:hypothetical protein [Planctomycetota bacterium]